MTNRYTVGTLVRISTVIAAVAGGGPVDPTTVSLTVRLPDGSDDDISSDVVKDSVGNYHADYLPPDTLGLYRYEWTGTGTVQVADIGSFFVDQGPL